MKIIQSSQRDKPKFKPKLKQKITALALAVVTAIIALPINALADTMTFGGNSDSSVTYLYGDGFKYGFKGEGQHVSWRISLYVSTSDDGTIDPKRDSISGTGLAKVGTIFYNNIFEQYGDDNIGADVFVQAAANTENRGAGFANKMINTSKNRNQNTPTA